MENNYEFFLRLMRLPWKDINNICKRFLIKTLKKVIQWKNLAPAIYFIYIKLWYFLFYQNGKTANLVLIKKYETLIETF